MREILLKGKRKDNGEWIEGSLITSINRAWISSEKTDSQRLRGISNTDAIWRAIEIIPDTICQFTGLCDKNGNKIWENDILKTRSGKYAQVKFGLYATDFASGDYNQGFYTVFPKNSYYQHGLGYWLKKTYVRGNIFDNPELLQGKSNE